MICLNAAVQYILHLIVLFSSFIKIITIGFLSLCAVLLLIIIIKFNVGVFDTSCFSSLIANIKTIHTVYKNDIAAALKLFSYLKVFKN